MIGNKSKKVRQLLSHFLYARRDNKLFVLTFVHSRNVKRRKIPASAIFSTKFASSIVSPASARAKRIPSSDNMSEEVRGIGRIGEKRKAVGQ